MKKSQVILTASLFACMTGSIGADVHSPWVLSEHVADTSSMEAFGNDPRWKNKTGQDRALAIWKYLVDNETGVFHYNPIREGKDQRNSELHIVRDPIKMINVYGYGFCGAFGPTTAGIFEKTGFEKARAIGIPGCNHCVTEVWYDGDWHYFDTDLRGVLFERDGKTIASIREVIEQPDLWTKPSKKIEPFFTNDRDLSVYARTYGAKPVDYLYRWFSHGSTMDYRLRKGETFTRWWEPQGGRWSHQEQDVHGEFWEQLIKREPYGAKGNHSNFSIWTHGNGLFDYQPRLRSGYADFEDGVFDHYNVRLTERGVTLAKPGEGEVVFEVNSPYVIVPKVGNLMDRADDREASVVTFASHGRLRVSFSLDFGRSFQELKTIEGEGETTIDLTSHLRERYQYLLKFTLVGKPDETVLESLRMRTWVQVAPASLARLKQGVNHLQFQLDDKHGLPTTPWMQTPFLGDHEEMSRYWLREPKDYQPDRVQARVKGEMDLLFTAPPGHRIKWMSLGGFFTAFRGEQAPRTRNEIWYAVDDSDHWQRVYQADVPKWNDHWHYAYDQEVMLDTPVHQVRVRYVGNPGVNAVRVNLHSLKPESKVPPDTTIVTHAYEMDGKLYRRQFKFDEPAEYEIDCTKTPKNVFIRLEVPNGPLPAN